MIICIYIYLYIISYPAWKQFFSHGCIQQSAYVKMYRSCSVARRKFTMNLCTVYGKNLAPACFHSLVILRIFNRFTNGTVQGRQVETVSSWNASHMGAGPRIGNFRWACSSTVNALVVHGDSHFAATHMPIQGPSEVVRVDHAPGQKPTTPAAPVLDGLYASLFCCDWNWHSSHWDQHS